MKKLLLFILTLVYGIQSGHAQQYNWLKQTTNYHGLGQGTGTQTITKSSNALIISSSFKDSLQLDNVKLRAPGRSDIFLAGYDLQGSLKWATQIKNNLSSNNAGALTSTTDGQGNTVIACQFKDSIRVGNYTYISTRPTDNWFIAKFDSTGTLSWLNTLETTTHISIHALATDFNNNVYATGFFAGNIILGNNTAAVNNSGSNMFLLKWNAGGSFKWVRQGVSPNSNGNGAGYGVAVSKTGDIILTGSVYNGISLGSITLNNSGVFLAKYDSSATIQWAHLLHTAGPTKVILDEQDNICLSGKYTGSLNFNSQLNLQTTSQGLFIAKADLSGNWMWATGFEASIMGYFNSLDTDTANNIYATGWFSGNLQAGNVSMPTTGTRNTFITKLDQAGNQKYIHRIGSTGSGYNAGTGIKTHSNGYLYLLGEFTGKAYFGRDSLTSYNTFMNRYFAKLTSNVNMVTGEVFLDFNHNQLRDLNEKTNTEVIVSTSPGYNFSNPAPGGEYYFALGQGSYNVAIPRPPKYYSVSPASHNLNFSGFGQQVNNKDFALQPSPNVKDVRITITNFSIARPGATLRYNVTIKNIGTVALSDTLSVTFPPAYLQFLNATPAATLQGNNLKWLYQNLQPNEKQEFNISFRLDTAVTLHTNFQTFAYAKPFIADQFLADNYDTLNHAVITSYDPNDKQVSHNWLTPQQVADSTLLNYVIRFQNTGTDTAFTVIIRDSISDKLYLPSFEILSASHPYTFRLLDNGMAEWRFDNISLPDSNRNEPASHGFIRYRMQPEKNLVLGDEIKSRAAIYFDYNLPIHTNYAVTRISLTNGIKEKHATIQAFKLYPNPAKHYVIVKANFIKNTAATVSLINLLGQTISKVNVPTDNQLHYKLPLNELPKGLYLIRLETESGMQTQRLIIQ